MAADLKIFTDDIEEKALEQCNTIAASPVFEDAKIRIMPDVHAGKGCVIGFTATGMTKLIPNLVGVDLGCLDKDTEILTPNGWIRISDYNNQKILTYDLENDTAQFDEPIAYIKNPCSEFYHLHHSKGLDQMISEEHKMVIWRGYRCCGYNKIINSAKIIIDEHNQHPKSNRCIKTTFHTTEPGLPITDNQIRLLVMISADGCIKHIGNRQQRIELHFRKARKISRAKDLLNANNIKFNEYNGADGTTYIDFHTDKSVTKSLQQFFRASHHQLKILIDEIYHWDGSIDHSRNHKFFSSNNKINADVVQYALHATGTRAGIYTVTYPDRQNWNPTYQTYETKNEYVGFPTETIQKVPSIDGWKYCFTTKTGFFIIRRNNNISITGNCGMLTAKLADSVDLDQLDEVINERVPSGFNVHTREDDEAQEFLDELVCRDSMRNTSHLLKSLGTLGGGNHFIEVDVDGDGSNYLIIHTGSRNLGLQVANIYQELAVKHCAGRDEATTSALIAELKAAGRQREISTKLAELRSNAVEVDDDLAWCSDADSRDYLHDAWVATRFAHRNREKILDIILEGISVDIVDMFHTVHNYVDLRDAGNPVIRKGAVAADAGERLLIPMNMRDGCLLCVGKGNEDWNCSAPHGAGRLMSRAQAAKTISLDDFRASMDGIYSTSVCESTLDESPFAYKSMTSILERIGDTVEVQKILKPVYNYKAH